MPLVVVTSLRAGYAAPAAAIQANSFEPESLDEVVSRPDELGQLAQVFQEMVRQVSAREQQWHQQMLQLRIEMNQAHTVREVVFPDREVK